MFIWPIVDVAIGLVFIYTLLSLVCSSVKEGISRIGSMRAKTMVQGLRMLLADSGTSGKLKEFLDHPLIKAFGASTDGKTIAAPSYIPARTFAQVVLDLVAPPGALTGSSLATSIASLTGNDELKISLLSLLRSADGDVTKFRAQIESWFDDAMDRVSGIYKRKTSSILLGLALLVVGATNADTLAIAAALWENPALARALDTTATDFANKSAAASDLGGNAAPPESVGKKARPMDSITESGATEVADKNSATHSADVVAARPKNTSVVLDRMVELQGQLQKAGTAGLPLGWYADQSTPRSLREWLMKLLGLLLTSAAVCLGAPFWFDVLSKLVNLRGTGGVPAKSGNT